MEFLHFNFHNLELAMLLVLVWCSSALVELGESHADSHRVLQEFLCTSSDAGLFLLVQSLATECVYAVGETSLHECIIHPQTAGQNQTKKEFK